MAYFPPGQVAIPNIIRKSQGRSTKAHGMCNIWNTDNCILIYTIYYSDDDSDVQKKNVLFTKPDDIQHSSYRIYLIHILVCQLSAL